jgi:hypothetical protein
MAELYAAHTPFENMEMQERDANRLPTTGSTFSTDWRSAFASGMRLVATRDRCAVVSSSAFAVSVTAEVSKLIRMLARVALARRRPLRAKSKGDGSSTNPLQRVTPTGSAHPAVGMPWYSCGAVTGGIFSSSKLSWAQRCTSSACVTTTAASSTTRRTAKTRLSM